MGQCDIIAVTVVLLVVALTKASNNPCDPLTAECSGGVCCKDCFFKQEGTLCRRKNSPCDVPEYCTGEESFCPRNTFLPAGISCGDGDKTCYQGLCLAKNFDSEDVISKQIDKTLEDEKQSEESAASFLSPNETRLKRNAPKAPESAINSDPPIDESKNVLLVPFVAVAVTAVIMLIICARTCVGFYRERDMRHKLEKVKVTVEPATIQPYTSTIDDIYVYYDVAMPTNYQLHHYQAGQRKKRQKKNINQSEHYYTGLSEHYYADQSELDQLHYLTVLSEEDDSRQSEQHIFDQTEGENIIAADHYQTPHSEEINAQTSDQSGLKPNIQSGHSQPDQSEGVRVLSQSEQSEPGQSEVDTITQSEHIQPDRLEICTRTKPEQSEPRQLEVYSSIQSEQNEPDQLGVYTYIQSEQNEPDQLEVYTSIQSEQSEPDQLKVYTSIQSEKSEPDQLEVYSSIQLELGQHHADQSEQFPASRTHEFQHSYYQPLTSLDDLPEEDSRYQELMPDLARHSSSEENK